MGVEKFRNKRHFMGPAVFQGSLTVNGRMDVSTTAVFSGTTDLSGATRLGGAVTASGGLTVSGSFLVTAAGSYSAKQTFNGVIAINTVPALKSSSAAAQFAGRTTVGCGDATAVISTTAVKSNSIILLTPIPKAALPAIQASGSIPSGLCVNTITEGGFFVVGWIGGVGLTNIQTDVAWMIAAQG